MNTFNVTLGKNFVPSIAWNSKLEQFNKRLVITTDLLSLSMVDFSVKILSGNF